MTFLPPDNEEADAQRPVADEPVTMPGSSWSPAAGNLRTDEPLRSSLGAPTINNLWGFGTAGLTNAEMRDAAIEAEAVISGRTDTLFQAAKHVVTDAGYASLLVLQRALGIGYGRADRLLKAMAADGFIIPRQNRPGRYILATDREPGSAATEDLIPGSGLGPDGLYDYQRQLLAAARGNLQQSRGLAPHGGTKHSLRDGAGIPADESSRAPVDDRIPTAEFGEPWRRGTHPEFGTCILDCNGNLVSMSDTQFWQRVLACVNQLAGIPTSALVGTSAPRMLLFNMRGGMVYGDAASIQDVSRRLGRLQTAEVETMSWEQSMMATLGTDGVNSAVEAIEALQERCAVLEGMLDRATQKSAPRTLAEVQELLPVGVRATEAAPGLVEIAANGLTVRDHLAQGAMLAVMTETKEMVPATWWDFIKSHAFDFGATFLRVNYRAVEGAFEKAATRAYAYADAMLAVRDGRPVPEQAPAVTSEINPDGLPIPDVMLEQARDYYPNQWMTYRITFGWIDGEWDVVSDGLATIEQDNAEYAKARSAEALLVTLRHLVATVQTAPQVADVAAAVSEAQYVISQAEDPIASTPRGAGQYVNRQLLEALVRLSQAAQMTGGVAGRDEELVRAIDNADVAIRAAGGAA